MDATRKTNADYYNQNADVWAAKKTNSFYHEEGFRKFHSLLRDDDSVIDIGCAYGIHVPLFLGIGRNLSYEGFDISEKMVEIARSHYPQLPFSVADILDKESLPQKKFQAFWAGAVLMHIPEEQWKEMLTNIEVMSQPSAIGYLTLPDARPNEASEKDQRHFSLIPQEKLEDILKERGWKFLERGSFPDDPRDIWHWYLVQLPD
jgi:SAM-dependent methyltransferase